VVVTTRVPALIVPDEQLWTMRGSDPASLGLEPTFALGKVEHVLVPEALPDPLAEPLRACLAAIPAGATFDEQPLALPSADAAEHISDADHARHHGHHAAHRGRQRAEHEHHAGRGEEHAQHEHQAGGGEEHARHEHHAGHSEHHGQHDDQSEREPHGGHAGHAASHNGGHDAGHHDHHDMMAIVGEPSRDGLVMEPIELRYGPLGTPLPGGLAVDVTLDGDVVAEATVHALLEAPTDPLAPWSTSPFPGWDGVVAIELERARSHLAWLRAFARMLGWSRLVDICTDAIAALPDPVAAQRAVDAVATMVHESRSLRVRTRGKGIVSAGAASAAGLDGPNARASGLTQDPRGGDRRYLALGFAPVTRTEGDALARTLVRVDEASAGVRLAAAASQATGEAPSEAPLDGPRGTGGGAARQVAGEAMVGAEWSAALAILASFDLSPWRVPV
jgi:hypothetical protein